MKYKVLYDTLINKNHTKKGSIIEFPSGTDEGYIKRLVANKVIEVVVDAKQAKSKNTQKQAKTEDTQDEKQATTQEAQDSK